jgi:hypothetical protein
LHRGEPVVAVADRAVQVGGGGGPEFGLRDRPLAAAAEGEHGVVSLQVCRVEGGGGVGGAGRHRKAWRQAELGGGAWEQGAGRLFGAADRRELVVGKAERGDEVIGPGVSLQVVEERAGGVGRIGRGLAGQLQPKPVLGLQGPLGGGDVLRLVLCEPAQNRAGHPGRGAVAEAAGERGGELRVAVGLGGGPLVEPEDGLPYRGWV